MKKLLALLVLAGTFGACVADVCCECTEVKTECETEEVVKVVVEEVENAE